MTHKRTYLAARALLLIVASIGPTAALAQTTAAQITGIVKDPTGAMIPGANVRIENQQTGNFLLTVTSDEGRYLFRSLEPGNYSLTVSMPSFKTQTLTDVVLHVAQSARLDIALEVGQPSETLTVTETTPLLESEGAAVGSIITTQQLTELPLNGRNFVGLAILAPGATNGFSNNYQTYFFGNRSETSVVQANGVRSEFTSTTIDGINTQTIDRHWTSVIYPSIDMIKEFKAETSNYLADTSGGGGVNLNVATKSGTNEIHGTAFEFLQNRALNARNFFLPENRSKPDEKYNQFGFTVGGPVSKTEPSTSSVTRASGSAPLLSTASGFPPTRNDRGTFQKFWPPEESSGILRQPGSIRRHRPDTHGILFRATSFLPRARTRPRSRSSNWVIRGRPRPWTFSTPATRITTSTSCRPEPGRMTATSGPSGLITGCQRKTTCSGAGPRSATMPSAQVSWTAPGVPISTTPTLPSWAGTTPSARNC